MMISRTVERSFLVRMVLINEHHQKIGAVKRQKSEAQRRIGRKDLGQENGEQEQKQEQVNGFDGKPDAAVSHGPDEKKAEEEQYGQCRVTVVPARIGYDQRGHDEQGYQRGYMTGSKIQQPIKEAVAEPSLQPGIDAAQKVRNQVRQPVCKTQYSTVLPGSYQQTVLFKPADDTAVVPDIHEPGRQPTDQPVRQAVFPEPYDIPDRL